NERRIRNVIDNQMNSLTFLDEVSPHAGSCSNLVDPSPRSIDDKRRRKLDRLLGQSITSGDLGGSLFCGDEGGRFTMRQNARPVLRGLLSIAERKTGILEPGIHIVFDSPQKMIRSNPGDFRFDGIARQDLVTANKGSFGQKRIQPA